MRIQEELPGHAAGVRHVNEQAFGRSSEADLVDALRRNGGVALSLVAEQAGEIVGHVLFSPVRVVGPAGEYSALGLAPVAVLPEVQRQGIGGALIREGLMRLREAGHHLVVLAGHPSYYPRFGFVRASRLGLACIFDVPDDAFMAIVLDGAPVVPGTVHYRAEFDEA